MARCRFTPLSKQDLKEINRFIALDNPDAARRFIALIKQKCQTLAEFPEMGRSWDDLDIALRSFPVGDYLIFYRSGVKSGVEVIAVVQPFPEIASTVLLSPKSNKLLDSDQPMTCYSIDLRQKIVSVGAKLEYLPVYSPDFNPIEMMWSQIKSWVRKVRTQTVRALSKAIETVVKLIHSSFLKHWFAKCSYCTE